MFLSDNSLSNPKRGIIPILRMSKMRSRVTLSQPKATLIRSGGTQIWNQFSGSNSTGFGLFCFFQEKKNREILEVITKI